LLSKVSLQKGGFFYVLKMKQKTLINSFSFGGFPGFTNQLGLWFEKVSQYLNKRKERTMNPKAKMFVQIKILQALSIGWHFATYALFLEDHGLNPLQINLVNWVFMTSNLVIDPFTGYIGDRIGQKKIYQIGTIFWGLGMFVYGITQAMNGFIIAEALAALGAACMSEALESWLRNQTNEDITHQTLAKTGSLASLATIPVAIIGGILSAKVSNHLPWLLGAVTSLVVFLVSRQLLNGEKAVVKQKTTLTPLPMKQIFLSVWQTPSLRLAALIGLVANASFMPFNMFWAPVLRKVSGQSWWLGSLWIGVATLTALGSRASKGKLNQVGWGISLVLFSIGLPMLFPASFSESTLIIASCFLLHEIGRGTIRPLLFTFANRSIEDQNRMSTNTVLSSSNMLGRSLGLLISGGLTLYLSRLSIWRISALVLIVLALLVWTARKNE